MGWRSSAALFALGLTACGDYPRDCVGTLDSVHESRTVRLGLAPTATVDRPMLARLTTRLGDAADARIEFVSGPEEELLARLERGDLDVVAGSFVEDSPWLADAALIEPLTSRLAGDRKIGLALVARNGENAWIGMLERTVRDLRGER